MTHLTLWNFYYHGAVESSGSCCSPLNDRTLPEVSGVFMEGRKKKSPKSRKFLEHHPSFCLLYNSVPAFVTFGKLGTEIK